MGSWYETCGLTHLPIQEGEEVIAFIVKKQQHIYKEHSGFNKPDDWYTPVHIGIEGEYNDYGGMKNITEEVLHYKSLNDMLNEGRYSREESDNVYEIIEKIQQGEIEPLGIMYVLKDACLKIQEEMKTRESYFETLQNDMEKAVRLKEEYLKTEDDDERKYLKAFQFYDNVLQEEYNRIIRFYGKFGRHMRHLLDRSCEENHPILQEKMIELVLFHRALDLMRKGWMPQGSGNQFREFYMHTLLADYTQKKAEQYKQEWLEENIPDEDFDENELLKEGIGLY